MATISQSRMLSIVANPSCVRVCRPLALLHEEFLQAARVARKGAGCSGCDLGDAAFDPVRGRAMEALAAMGDEDLDKLKAFIQEDSVTFYIGTGKSITKVTR